MKRTLRAHFLSEQSSVILIVVFVLRNADVEHRIRMQPGCCAAKLALSAPALVRLWRLIRGIVIDESALIFLQTPNGCSVPRFCSDPLSNDPPLPGLFEIGISPFAIRFERIEFVKSDGLAVCVAVELQCDKPVV